MKAKTFAAAVMALAIWSGGAPAGEKPLRAKDLSVKGVITGENITFTVSFTVEPKRAGRELPLVTGDLALETVAEPKEGRRIRYDKATSTYYVRFARGGKHKITATFAARPKIVAEGPWREATFAIPASRVRELEVACDRSDLEILFPGAMRLEREVKDEKLTVKAVLGPGRPFAVRWKPQVREMDAALVLASEANTVATASAGALRVDTLFVFDISQGKMKEVSFSIPKSLSVTGVRGAYIRDWRVATEGEAKAKTLKVVLARPQTKQYAVQIQSEMALADFPVELDMPVIAPQGGIRSNGSVAVGTDSAIRLVVKKTGGLSQTNSTEFPRIILDRKHPRPLPKSNAFFYSYAATPYQMKLSLDDIVPSYDANERLVLGLREDDLTVDVDVDLDVRDAPIRRLVVEVPSGFLVSSVRGNQVEDHRVHELKAGKVQQVEIHFRSPVRGHTLISMRLELGKSPLGAEQRVAGISVPGAKNERGSIVVLGEKGVQLETPRPQGLREVHVGSVPMRVANAQFAYRFRERGWSLGLLAREKPAGVRTEAFHLISIGDGVVYGSVVVNYFVSGAPVDELYFRVPDNLQNVEFVGSDVRSWAKAGNLLKVKLQRKIIGDYNIGLTHSQRYEDGSKILVGGVECARVETQTGYICIASHLNLKLEPKGKPDANLLEIDRSEVPSNYRLLVNAPTMRTYKYVNTPHSVSMGLTAYERTGLLPVVVEVMEIETELAVGEKRQTESVTRIRYKVKNSSSQFLTLGMPEGASVWSTHIIERRTGERHRVTSSHDKAAGLLKIPLRRRRNPNEPVTVELEYGQAHGRIGWGGGIEFAAPKNAVRSTYAHWTLKAPKDWAVLPRDRNGNMVPEDRAVRRGSLSLVMGGVLSSWEWSLERLLGSYWSIIAGVVIAGLLAAVFAFKRSALPALVLGGAVVLVLGGGIVAAAAPSFERGFASKEDLTTLTFTQTLSLDEKSPPAISASVVPAWRQYAGLGSLLIVPGLALIALSLALVALFRATTRRRARALAAAFGVIGLLWSAARFPVPALVMGHLFTWGLPTLLALYFLVRCSSRAKSLSTATALALLGSLLISGCGPSAVAVRAKSDAIVLDRVECTLAAEKDSMEIDLRLSVSASKALRFPVVDHSAILLSPERASKHVKVEEASGRYYVHILRKGKYDVALKFLSPLAKAGEDELRHFRMPLPAALTNRVRLTVPETGMEIEAPTAVRLDKEETEKSTVARAILGPGDPVFFIWKPRTRQTKLEKTAFFADVTSLFRFNAGLAEGRHRLRFQIAQGELKVIRLRVPEKTAVTAVEGKNLGAWRFDPAKREIEARLAASVSDDYEMTVVTQVSSEGLPASVSVGTLQVLEAVRQRGTIGLTTSPSVYVTVEKHPHKMSVEDFARESAELISAVQGLKSTEVRHAYRSGRPGEVLEVKVHEVKPEIRVHEVAGFWVGDERLVYDTGAKGGLAISVAKAGVFSVSMKLPEGYDIDTLTAPQVSHWDENAEGGVRAVQVHFKQKLRGTVVLKLALSRSVSKLPEKIALPRIRVESSLKHTGQVAVSAARGIRLSEAERKGVSSINPLELGRRSKQGVLVYKLLKPEWQLLLKTEVVEPRVNVDFLHVAKVTEGLIQHTHYLRYRLYNAGAKVFEVDVPKAAIGLLITGSEIAHSGETSPGRWRVELTRKKFDQPYLLTVRYETRFDRSAGEVKLAPVKAAGVDLQRGHIVVYATDRVELAELSRGEMLRAAEARSISSKFGAGDLSGAAFCYASTTPGYDLSLRAKRHEAASVLEAEVLETTITTVVSEHGENINHVRMQLRVGGKRNLEALLPAGARIWSLMVNGRSTAPSGKSDDSNGKVVLIPLPQTPSGELTADVDFVYVASRPGTLAAGRQQFPGPKFDLPLKKLKWRFYLPEGYDYDDFKGTLAVNEEVLRRRGRHRYNIRRYEQEVDEANKAQEKKVDYFQDQGKVLARKGRQYAARYAFENAYNYSFSNPARNEDARVQLHNLIRGQAVVGLVGRRDHLRPRTGVGGELPAQAAPARNLGDRFNQAEAERLRSSLSKADSENLERITKSIIETQEAAAGSAVQIVVSVPLRGQIVEFDRPLQVKPNSDMLVSFDPDPVVPPNVKKDWAWTIGFFVCLFFVLLARPGVERKWSELRRSLKRREAELAAERDGARETPGPEDGMGASHLEGQERGAEGLEDEGPETLG